MGKPTRQSSETPKRKTKKNYHKNKKGKEIAANFGLKKYKEGKTVGKSFYMVFNPDSIIYTPTFIEENVGMKLTQEEYYRQYEKKIKRSQLRLNQTLKQPKPRGGASRYCAVCKKHFDQNQDYATHIVKEDHLKIIENDEYNVRIQKLEKYYRSRKLRRWEKFEEQKKKKKQKQKQVPQQSKENKLPVEKPRTEHHK